MATRTKPGLHLVESAIELVNGHFDGFSGECRPGDEWKGEPPRMLVLPGTIEPMCEAVTNAYVYLAQVFAEAAVPGDRGSTPSHD